MRILAFSDVHGVYGELERVLAPPAAFDVIVIAGDLTTIGTAPEARAAVRTLLGHGKPVLTVAGNMDPGPVEDELRALGVSIDGRGRVIDGVGFFGVSGAPVSPLRTPNEITEDEIRRRAEQGWAEVAACRRTVFVPHPPPANTALDRLRDGRHVGSVAVREVIAHRHPAVVVCGHIHEARGVDQVDGTPVVNCGLGATGSYAVVEVGDEVTITLHDRRE